MIFVYMGDEPDYPDSNLALHVGGLYELDQSLELFVDYSFLQSYIHQFGVGLIMDLTPYNTVGIELVYRDFLSEEEEDTLTLELNAHYHFSAMIEQENDEEDLLFNY